MSGRIVVSMTQEGDRNTVEGRRSKNGMFALEVPGVVLFLL